MMRKGEKTRHKVERSKRARPGTRRWIAQHHTEAQMGSSTQADTKEIAARRILEKRREKDVSR